MGVAPLSLGLSLVLLGGSRLLVKPPISAFPNYPFNCKPKLTATRRSASEPDQLDAVDIDHDHLGTECCTDLHAKSCCDTSIVHSTQSLTQAIRKPPLSLTAELATRFPWIAE